MLYKPFENYNKSLALLLINLLSYIFIYVLILRSYSFGRLYYILSAVTSGSTQQGLLLFVLLFIVLFVLFYLHKK